MKQDIIAKIKNAPKDPGVYIFYTDKTPIYVGKAANLRARLKSYLKITDYKTEALQKESTSLEHIILRSDIEALIEESRLIKELKPRYNVLQRDDKSYSYVYFTKDKFPKILVGHQKPKPYTLVASRYSRIGPFTDSGSLRTALNTIRRYFPYCTCLQGHFRECLNGQIGKCLGFCCMKNPEKVDLKAYQKNIRSIKAILRGQSQKLLKTLENDTERFALEKIFEHQPYLNLRNEPERSSRNPAAGGLGGFSKIQERSDTKTPPSRGQGNFSLEKISGLRESVRRVECFDNSHLTGKEAVGALTALVKINGIWQSDKNSYRKFKIKSADTQDDPRMMAEVVERRLRHPEWLYPDLMIIDGGITQYRSAKSVFEKLRNEFPEIQKINLISMAKPQKLVYGLAHKATAEGLAENDLPTSIEKLDKELRQVIEHAIYQTHHFVIRYHRSVRNREFLPK